MMLLSNTGPQHLLVNSRYDLTAVSHTTLTWTVSSFPPPFQIFCQRNVAFIRRYSELHTLETDRRFMRAYNQN